LFGEQTNTMSGWYTRTCALACSASSSKLLRRVPPIQRVPVTVARSGCMEYDGRKPNASRPAPPNACSNCWRISFDPFAAHTFAEVSP
jgi:hypothetical protein